MNRSLSFAILFLLILSACGSGPRAVEKYVGTDGVTIEFAENAPPETLYENMAFPARVLVRNAGAADVPAERMVLTFSVDPLYISGGVSPYFPARHDTEHKVIYGKSPAFPDGQLLAYSMPIENAFSANRVLGQREQPKTSIAAGVCYAYTTFYSASVCIDTNSYDENLREQPCEAEDISTSGGQGAPIAITNVRIQAFPVIDRELGIEAVRPQFTFTIEDVGQGQLVGPDTLELAPACLLQGIAKEQLGAVRIQAFLLNTPLECQPEGLVRLIEGTGEVRCTVPKNELTDPIYASAQNYHSTLIVNLSYIYKSTTKVEVEIERGQSEGDGQVIPVGGRVTGYEYVRATADVPQVTLPEGEVQLTTTGPVITDSTGAEWKLLATPEGKPVTSCDLYANNPELIPDGRGQLSNMLNPSWNCACGQTRCATLSRSGQCLAGLCPGNTYCCTDVKPTVAEPEPGTTTGTDGTTSTGSTAFAGSGTPGNLASWRDAIVSGACSAGVYPSIVAAQFQLESSSGSRMPAGSNNPFGIKCGSSSRCVSAGTSECSGSACSGTTASFRVFDSVDEAIAQQGGRLMGTVPGLSSSITGPFSQKINARDRDGAVRVLQGTYATDPIYASKLLGIIRTNRLNEWDSCIS